MEFIAEDPELLMIFTLLAMIAAYADELLMSANGFFNATTFTCM